MVAAGIASPPCPTRPPHVPGQWYASGVYNQVTEWQSALTPSTKTPKTASSAGNLQVDPREGDQREVSKEPEGAACPLRNKLE